MMQVTDVRTLRKLLKRVDEIPEVKNVLTAICNNGPSPSNSKFYIGDVIPLLSLKKVRENQHMTAILQEIQEYLSVGNLDAAKSAAKRVLDVPQAVQIGKPREQVLRVVLSDK